VVLQGIKNLGISHLEGKVRSLWHVTCGNVAKNVLSSLIIIDVCKILGLRMKYIPGSKYGTSDKSWINVDLFRELVKGFIPTKCSGYVPSPIVV